MGAVVEDPHYNCPRLARHCQLSSEGVRGVTIGMHGAEDHRQAAFGANRRSVGIEVELKALRVCRVPNSLYLTAGVADTPQIDPNLPRNFRYRPSQGQTIGEALYCTGDVDEGEPSPLVSHCLSRLSNQGGDRFCTALEVATKLPASESLHLLAHQLRLFRPRVDCKAMFELESGVVANLLGVQPVSLGRRQARVAKAKPEHKAAQRSELDEG